MGRELGRISGPLLADNLRRNGANLAFDNQVLYLDVVNGRVGFNSNSPVNEVYAPNAIDTVNLIVDTQSNLANFTITTNTIQDAISSITISPNQSSTPTIVTPAISTANLVFRDNVISNTVSNDPINITATGIGVINLNSDTTVTGNLHATGNITWDGDITLGDNLAQDTVTFGADVGSSILPSVTNSYDLGNNTTPLRWGTTYVNTTTATNINTTNLSTTTFIGSGTNGLNGDVIIGTNSGNTLTVTARINSGLIPATTNTYNLGSSTGPLYWNNVYAITFNNGNITLTNNTIQTNTTNSNLRLIANGSGQVVFSKLNVTNNVTVGGTLGVTGTSTLTNTATGAITQTGNYNLTGDTGITGNLSTVNITQIDNGAVVLQLPRVTITGSNIDGTASNTDLQFIANGSGRVLIPSNNLQVTNNATVGGTLTVTGTSTLANTSTGAITQTGDFNQTGNTTISGTLTSGNITTVAPFTLPGITIDTNSIQSTTSNTDLQFTASGSGKIIFSSLSFPNTNNVSIGGTLGVTGTTTLNNDVTSGAITQTGDFNQTGDASVTGTYTVSGDVVVTGAGSYLNIGNFNIANQTITSTVTNDTITFLANGVGYTWLGNDLKIRDNALINNWINQSVPYAGENNQIYISEDGQTLYTEFGIATALQDSILFTPTGTGNVVINSNKSIGLPVGDDVNSLLIDNGAIRFNDINLNIEGYSNTGYVNFFNLYSQDYNTYITPELTPNASDNLLRFGIAGNVTTTVSSATLYSNTMHAGNIRINANNISNTSATTNLTFTTSGTGLVKFNGINYVSSNNFYMPTNAGLYLENTGQGHVKFGGTAGIVVPYGTPSDYPTSPQIGTLRFNTLQDILEIYDGNIWTAAYGVASSLSETEIASLVEVYTLLLGF